MRPLCLWAIGLVLICLVGACTSEPKPPPVDTPLLDSSAWVEAPPPPPNIQEYGGIIANGVGDSIQMNLLFNVDDVWFERQMTFLGYPDSLFSDSGPFSFIEGIPDNPRALVYGLETDSLHIQFFWIKNDQEIVLLDSQMNRFPDDSTGVRYTLRRQ
ncbi:MAG: hypothetical protein H6555_11345 [Lewinellaceae bacterium]|nr:hypothetical protein [Lewinellaceae bacterium]